MSAERVEYLRERLLEDSVTVAEIREYIFLNHAPSVGMVQQPLLTFITEGDLPDYFWLRNWWAPVQDKPKTLLTPTIAQFCWFANHTPGAPPVTFNEALRQFYGRCVAHCKANDLPIDNPAESAEERKRRRNRARMAAAREHRRVPDKNIKDEGIAVQVRAIEARIAEIKAQTATLDAALREEVLQYQSAMTTASAQRRQLAEETKQRIDNFRAQIKALTQKQ